MYSLALAQRARISFFEVAWNLLNINFGIAKSAGAVRLLRIKLRMDAITRKKNFGNRNPPFTPERCHTRVQHAISCEGKLDRARIALRTYFSAQGRLCRNRRNGARRCRRGVSRTGGVRRASSVAAVRDRSSVAAIAAVARTVAAVRDRSARRQRGPVRRRSTVAHRGRVGRRGCVGFQCVRWSGSSSLLRSQLEQNMSMAIEAGAANSKKT